jgi:glucokinase
MALQTPRATPLSSPPAPASGEATLHRVQDTLVPLLSERGHADFGPCSDREVELVRLLLEERGRIEVE